MENAKHSKRVTALDWMRGLVMILMTIDHASDAINANRFFTDADFLYRAGTALPLGQFLTRWITHLCAPTFVFLAGTAMALSAAKRSRMGESELSFDRYLFVRGLILIALEPLWMSWGLLMDPSRIFSLVFFQVLFAIGGGFWLLILCRRLPALWLLILGLLIAIGNEAIGDGLLSWSGGSVPGNVSLITGLFSQPGVFANGVFLVFYPLLPWFAAMLLGWAFGCYLVHVREHSNTVKFTPRQILLFSGIVSLLLFVLVRAINGYGNEGLLRGESLLSWIHVSKYPPSFSFLTLELGIMALFLAGFWGLSNRSRIETWLAPLRLFGKTALLFYLLHVHILMAGVLLFGVRRAYSLGATYLATIITVILLYPICRWYRAYKERNPDGWTRYL